MGGTEGGASKAPPKRIVVKTIKTTRKRDSKRAKKSTAAGSGQRNRALPKPTGERPACFGLPSFRLVSSHPSRRTIVDEDPHPTNNAPSFDLPNEEPGEEIPSDTLIAIQSLIQSDQGLHVPITNNGSVQVLLERQIYSVFDENHASIVNTEVLELIRNNKVKRMFCHGMSTMALMRTEDYVKAIWDYHNNLEKDPGSATLENGGSSEEIMTWFVAQLHYWTKLSISESSFEERWYEANRETEDADVADPRGALKYLLNAQFLIRDPRQNLSSGGKEDCYFLWLPNWGIVLKSWNEARQQLLTLLAQRKEMSKANVLQKNRHSRVSTNFLLNELVWTETIRVVERPFGSFIQLVKDS